MKKTNHPPRNCWYRAGWPEINLVIIFCLCISWITTYAQITIPSNFFGSNLWFSNYTDAPFGTGISTLSAGNWTRTSSAGVKVMRIGGTAYNTSTISINFPHTGTYPNYTLTPAGYVKITDDVRNNGFEPMIEVPFDDRTKTRSIAEQAADAAEIVRSVNVTHQRKVKYWIIGNEPSGNQGYTGLSLEQAQRIRDYITKYSVEMKKVDPTIMIIGPELEYDNSSLLNKLFASPSASNTSITGTIPATFQAQPTGGASGKYYVDYLSFHEYADYISAFSGVSVRQGYTDAAYTFSNTFAGIYSSYINVSGSGRNSSNLKVMVDEFNMDGSCTFAASTAYSDITNENKSGNTFLAGQLLADMMGGMLSASDGSSNPVYENACPWSVSEGCSMGLIYNSVPKPTYWHYWLMANYFKGAFYPNKVIPAAIGNVSRCYRAYGCKAGNYIAVLVINQTQSVSSGTTATYASGAKTFSVNFDNNFGSNDFVFDMSQTSWGSAVYSGTINPKASALLFFDCSNTTSPTSAYLGRYDIEESAMSSPSTFTPPYSGTPVSVPAITVASPTVCTGSSTSLTAPTGSSFAWYKLPDRSSSISTSSVLTGASAGLYEVVVNGGCTPVAYSAMVHETSPIISPTVSYVQNCSGSSVNLTVQDGGVTYTWNPGAATGTNISVSPTVTTTYSVSQTYTPTGCSTTETISVAIASSSPTEDLWIQDNLLNSYPEEPGSQLVTWDSPDIWFTYSVTGTPTGTVEYKTNGDPNYIHINVRNGGSQTATGYLNLYWVKGASAITWSMTGGPGTWINSTGPGTPTTVTIPYGDQIGIPIPVSVPSGTLVEYTVPWFPPNPNDFSSTFTATSTDKNHFCILARLTTGCGMTYPEISNSWYNVTYNNNIAQKNLMVYDNNASDIVEPPPTGVISELIVQNTETITTTTKFELDAYTNDNGQNIFNVASPFIHLDPDLYAIWVAGGSTGFHVSDVGDNTIKITGNNATLSNIDLPANSMYVIGIRHLFKTQASLDYNFEMDLIQFKQGSDTLGGEHITVIPPTCPTASISPTSYTIDRGCSQELDAAVVNDNAEYVWSIVGGTSVGTGTQVSVSPTLTTNYSLKVAQNGCTQTTSCTVHVTENTCSGKLAHFNEDETIPKLTEENITLSVRPNPTNEKAIITYSLAENKRGELTIVNSYGQTVLKTTVGSEKKFELDCSKFAIGVYYITISDGKTFQKTKIAVIR